MSDVTADAIAQIVGLAPPNIVDGAPGFKLSNKELKASDIRPALPDAVEVETLSGLVDLIEQKAYPGALDSIMVKLAGPALVSLVYRQSDEYGRRPLLAYAKLPGFEGFPFGQFLSHEDFVIKVMTLFAGYQDDRDYVIQMAKSVTAGNTVTTSDDGITQNIVIQTGAALKSAVTMKSRVLLSPFRTFRETTQPTSEFAFRLKQLPGQASASLALIESDGGAWRIDAMKNIQTWLTNALNAQGVGDVPVIA